MQIRFVTLVLILLTGLISCKKNEENPIVYQSTLSTTDSKWFSGSATGYSCGFNQGKYEIAITLPGYYAYALAPVSGINYPYSVSVNASIQLSDTSRYGYYGVFFNFIDTKNYNALSLLSTGSFSIIEYTNGNFSRIVPFTQTNALKNGSGKTNTIQLLQNTSSLEVLLNNTSINTFPIVLVPNSKVGLYTQSSSQNFTNTIGAFSNIVIKKL